MFADGKIYVSGRIPMWDAVVQKIVLNETFLLGLEPRQLNRFALGLLAPQPMHLHEHSRLGVGAASKDI